MHMLVKNKLIYMIISCIIILRIIYKLCSGRKELQVEMQVGKEAAINVLTLLVVCKMTLKSTLLIFMCFFLQHYFTFIYFFFHILFINPIRFLHIVKPFCQKKKGFYILFHFTLNIITYAFPREHEILTSPKRERDAFWHVTCCI